jgi:hypothetical protein
VIVLKTTPCKAVSSAYVSDSQLSVKQVQASDSFFFSLNSVYLLQLIYIYKVIVIVLEGDHSPQKLRPVINKKSY